MTHTDLKAEYGALVIALAAHLAARDKEVTGRRFLDIVAANLPSDAAELLSLLTRAVESVEAGESTRDFAISLGLDKGVTGYMYHTVPVCIHAWLSFADDFEQAVRCIIECGGDADTTAAIVGGIAGASVGAKDIRPVWKTKLYEPHSVVEIIGMSVKHPELLRGRSLACDFYCLRLLRNVFVFLPLVLFHGFRRLLPPY